MARKKAAIEEVPMELTPMIDVVFLLLIFFMVTLKFKVLEGKLQTYLPKDVGVNQSEIDELLEKIDIYIETFGRGEFEFVVRVNAVRMPDLQAFYSKIRSMRQVDPELKATLYPGKNTTYEQVVRVVDEMLRAEMLDITFAGVPLDS